MIKRVDLRRLASCAAALGLLVGPQRGAIGAEIPEHISRPGYLVDQAWQIYRQLPVNWRACARICEPTDYRAADHEDTAFAYWDAHLRPGVPSAQRDALAKKALLFFDYRNTTVTAFRACLNDTHVLPRSALAPQAEPIPGYCETLNAETVWDKWCKSFDDFANQVLIPTFRRAYDTSVNNQLKSGTQLTVNVVTQVNANGIRDSVDGTYSRDFPKLVFTDIMAKVSKFKFPPFPKEIANRPAFGYVKFNWDGVYKGPSDTPFVSYSDKTFKMNCSDFYKYNQLVGG